MATLPSKLEPQGHFFRINLNSQTTGFTDSMVLGLTLPKIYKLQKLWPHKPRYANEYVKEEEKKKNTTV